MRSRLILTIIALLATSGMATSPDRVMSVCDLSKDYSRFRERTVRVRGVYYYGLRQDCSKKCADGPWPSFLNLEGGGEAAWAALAKADQELEAEARRTGQRFELWVTVIGRLQARAEHSPVGPCDRAAWGVYGHLGSFPAQLTVEAFRDIEVKVNPKSPYDYAHMYHGPA